MDYKERWSDDASYREAWHSRTVMLYRMIEDAKSILELGAGMCHIVGFLKPWQEYTPSDLVNRDEYSRGRKSIVMDFNSDPWEIEGPYDAVLLSGVLEYANDLPALVHNISTVTDTVACSYSDTTNERICQRNGWVNQFTFREFRQLFFDAGYAMIRSGDWNDQKLYKFERK